jgi:hypothetical protein
MSGYETKNDRLRPGVTSHRSEDIRDHVAEIGLGLVHFYEPMTRQSLPDRMRELLRRVAADAPAHQSRVALYEQL